MNRQRIKTIGALMLVVSVGFWVRSRYFELFVEPMFRYRTPAHEVAPVLKEKRFSQSPEIAIGQVYPASESLDAKEDWSSGPTPQWIRGADSAKSCVLRKTFSGAAKSARLIATCDNGLELFLNGAFLAKTSDLQHPVEVDAGSLLRSQENVLTAKISKADKPPAFALKLAFVDDSERTNYVVSDESWTVANVDSTANSSSSPAKVVARYGEKPWGDALKKPDGGYPGCFRLLPGFQIERLFTSPHGQLGSWVCLAKDDKGRFIVSDQDLCGLSRITPSPLCSREPTKVERLDVKISGAQGMLWAFNSLYLMVNDEASGLYRLRDTDGDDQFDEVEKLKELSGVGEHGPHSLRLSPDGKSIFVVGGNCTTPPFEVKRNTAQQTMGGIRSEQLHAELPADAVSRIAPNWDEDLLLPRHWNTDGHTHGVLAPGGWIAKTDPEGKTWEIVSIGYRNPYDAAFNADGELFVYDSDMEWDYGMPWYRPTRVAHATSGSDFGWRNGTAKWPPYYVDSLPPALEAGPGCPTGVEFGRGAAFPEKYQRALFICDWTYGIMYAVHLQPEGASYRAIKEEFLSRAPLALTDLVIGDDGAMYFIIGGRGVPSELFRVTYTGPESTSPVDLHDERGHELRELRQEIEPYQRPDADPETAVAFLTPQLAHPDRFIRYAARVSLERIPVDYWQDSILGASEAESVITGVVGLARQAESAAQPKLLAALDQLDWSQLDESQQLELLRAYQLVITRLGLPEEPTRLALGTKFDALFPTASDFINRELAILMVGLGSPRAADKIVPQLERARSDSKEDWSVLLSRNSYGDPLAAAQTNRPDAQQISYGYALRNLKTGWTPENQNKYFDWFERARTWTGGASYQRHIEAFENDALENDPDRKLLVAEAQTAHKPPPLPKPIGPGKDYTVDDLVELAQSKSQGRSFENGKRTFAAARCVVCHRFGDTGGAIGPDLTQVAGRFGVKEVAEAIIEPSKVVSDQYKATIIQTYEGQTYQGRIVSKTMDTITLLTDPEDLSKSVSIDRTRIEEQKRSTISLMPKDLLKPLNPTEVADLLAYILSRGNPRHPAFNP